MECLTSLLKLDIGRLEEMDQNKSSVAGKTFDLISLSNSMEESNYLGGFQICQKNGQGDLP